MKNLKLLNKKNLSIVLIFLLFGFSTQSQEPADIWGVEDKKTKENINTTENLEEGRLKQNTIYEMQSNKTNQTNVVEDQTLISKEIEIVGLYDPAKNGLDINMWKNSNGKQILKIIKNVNNINLSNDASEILDILLLTNSYYPDENISKEQFLKIKSEWLMKGSNFQLIEQYLLSNQIVNKNPKLAKYLVDYYLSQSEIEKSCEFFSKIKNSIKDEYLSKFNIYCLINNNKMDEAQLLLDLKKESGFSDKFYEKKISYLMGYNNKTDIEISENSILEFHLSHRTNADFKFESF